MLRKLPIYRFQPDILNKKLQKYYNLLEQTPLELTEKDTQIEVIPYEQLWQMVMNNLDYKIMPDK